MTNKEKYKIFCEKENNIPIFSKSWWLDCVCGTQNWDVAIVEKGGEVMASMPYYYTKKSIFNIITMPKLTQTMGPYIKYPNGQKYYKRISWEKEIIDLLLEQLPSYDYFIQNFNHDISNWLPFYWKNFSQTIRYTYIIDNKEINGDIEKTLLTESRRRRIKKARKMDIQILESDDIELFYKLNKKTFQRQKMKIPYSFDYVKKLYESCKTNDSVKIYFALFEDKVIAANFLIFDNNTVYYLMGGIEPEMSDLGAMDLIQLESIKFAIENDKIFDFEGSMIENIEKYFRSFGARQKSYSQITKTNSKLSKIRNFLVNDLRK